MRAFITTSLLLIGILPIRATAQTAEDLPIAHTTGFIENKGQLHDQLGKPVPHVRYLLNGPGLNVQLLDDGFSYDTWVVEEQAEETLLMINAAHDRPMPAERTYRFHRIDISFVGASPDTRIVASDPFNDHFNYYTQGTPEAGAVNVQHFRTVEYLDIVPGIDVRFQLSEGTASMEYDFVVHPGADMSAIRMRHSGAGATLDERGVLVFNTAFGELVETLPASWHEVGHERKSAPVKWTRNTDGTIGFAPADGFVARANATLVIDPVPTVMWSTMYGAEGLDNFQGVAIDVNGNSLASGNAQSVAAIATSGAHQTTLLGGSDAMLVKFDAAGVRLWGTYMGGSSGDLSTSVTTDASANIYICGSTSSTTGIATAGSHQPNKSSASDGFLVKFNTNGVRQWGTYYGGTGSDYARDVQCDGAGYPVIVGTTESLTGIASAGAADISYGGNGDAFVAKLSPSGVRQWATYMGGSQADSGVGTSNDGTFIYLVGTTASPSGIATSGTHKPTKSGGTDGYLVKYSGLGAKSWGTYYGGAADDFMIACLAEPSTGRIYICGGTLSSSGIATAGSHDASYNGTSTAGDGMLAKIDNYGLREWGTYYGGADQDWCEDIAIGYTGRIYVSGFTGSPTGIATADGVQPTLTNSASAFLTRFTTAGARIWGTYFNSNTNWMWARCAARNSIVLLGGDTRAQTITTPGCHQPNYGGGGFDAYLVRFSDPLFLLSPTQPRTEQAIVKEADGTVLLQPTATSVEGAATVRLMDIGGRVLGVWTWANSSASYRLDLSGAAPGVYMIIVDAAGEQRTARVVK